MPRLLRSGLLPSAVLTLVLALEFLNPGEAWALLILPRPSGVVRELWLALTRGPALADIGTTVARVGLGLLGGTLLGAPLGLGVGAAGRTFGGLRLVVDFIRSIPQIALFPVFALAFGIENTGKVMMAGVSSFLIVFVAAADGASFGVQERHETFAWIGASRWQRFRHLTLPQSLPSIAVGVRIAASVAVIVVLVAEMLYGTLDGIGYRLYLAQISYHVDEMWAYIVLVGALGMGLNAVLSSAQRRLIPWDRVATVT